MSTAFLTTPDSCTVLHGVAWDMYVELRENPDNDYLHMTYDRGRR